GDGPRAHPGGPAERGVGAAARHRADHVVQRAELTPASHPMRFLESLLTNLSTLGGLWPLWLPLLAGGAAIYLLLPRPRTHPVAWGALAGAAALLLAGGLLVQAGSVWQETVLFYFFSAVAVAAAALLVTQQNPARAALSFALVVLAVCGLFLLLAGAFPSAAARIVLAP